MRIIRFYEEHLRMFSEMRVSCINRDAETFFILYEVVKVRWLRGSLPAVQEKSRKNCICSLSVCSVFAFCRIIFCSAVYIAVQTAAQLCYNTVTEIAGISGKLFRAESVRGFS